MTKKFPLVEVSIVIPTFNRLEKLLKTLHSIEGLEFPSSKTEVLIVDDCSTDNTSFEIKKYITKKRNFKYFRTKKNSGPAHARNIGIKKSRGKYIFFTDDDCLVPKDILKVYITFLREHPGVWGIGGSLIPGSKNLIAKIELLKDKILGISHDEIKIGRDLPVGFTSNLIYRKEVFKKVGLFNEQFKAPAGEDKELRDRVVKFYDLASVPTKVIHNHDYNLDYFLSILVKQGLDKFPPKNKYSKFILLIVYLPYMIFNLFRKFLKYKIGSIK